MVDQLAAPAEVAGRRDPVQLWMRAGQIFGGCHKDRLGVMDKTLTTPFASHLQTLQDPVLQSGTEAADAILAAGSFQFLGAADAQLVHDLPRLGGAEARNGQQLEC